MLYSMSWGPIGKSQKNANKVGTLLGRRFASEQHEWNSDCGPFGCQIYLLGTCRRTCCLRCFDIFPRSMNMWDHVRQVNFKWERVPFLWGRSWTFFMAAVWWCQSMSHLKVMTFRYHWFFTPEQWSKPLLLRIYIYTHYIPCQGLFHRSTRVVAGVDRDSHQWNIMNQYS